MTGISIDDLRDDVRPIRVQFGDKVLRFEVYPDRMTNELMDRYRDSHEEPKDYDEMAAVFREFIKSWEITESREEDAPPLAMDGDTFRSKISIRVLNHIWAELSEALSPKSRKRKER